VDGVHGETHRAGDVGGGLPGQEPLEGLHRPGIEGPLHGAEGEAEVVIHPLLLPDLVTVVGRSAGGEELSTQL